MNSSRLGLGVPIMMLVAFMTGCEDTTRYRVVPVSGKIAFTDGTPFPKGAKLLFTPTEGGMGVAEAEVGDRGTFVVKHVKGYDGAELGKYTVTLRSPDGQEAEFFKQIPTSFADGNELFVEVKDGMGAVELRVPKIKGRR